MNDNGNGHLKPKIYEELSLEILETLPDNELEDAIINYIFTKFENARNESMRFEIISGMSLGFQMMWSTWSLLIGVWRRFQ